MNPLKPRPRSATPLLVAGFLLLALVVAMPIVFAAREAKNDGTVQKALVAEERLTDLASLMRQGENGSRGYLIAGSRISLHTYNIAMAQAPLDLQKLDAVLPGPEYAAQLRQLHQLVQDKTTELEQTMALLQAGKRQEAVAKITADLNRLTMVDIRNLTNQMIKAQMQRVAAGRTQEQHDAWALELATAIAVFAALLFALSVVNTHRDQTARLLAAEAALKAANKALERKVAELGQRTAELERIYKISSDIITVGNFTHGFTSVSPAWENITGHSLDDALTRPYTDFLHPEDQERTEAAFSRLIAGHAISIENRYCRADGSYCWLSWRAVPQPDEQLIYCVARDITAEREREEQLRQSQKMEVIGQLTGGVAHDFNNLLTIILGSLELLQRGMAGAEAKLTRRVDAAMEGARRAAALTHRLLAFSRRQPLEPKPLEINRLLAGMSDMLHRTLGETIQVELAGGAGLWQALADANQLENAILNLAVNARDAMPVGGHLSIETQNTYLDEVYAAGRSDIEAGQYVMIAVTDTGTGMSQEVQAKVFEPFFTTKPQGHGTGLGLAQVYGFIKQSDGHISLYSEAGEGTTIKLYLPRFRGVALPEAPSSQAGQPSPGRGQTVLVVEDEAGVRNFSAEVLSELGYKVLTAENAFQALSLFDATPGIQLLFTDVVLGGGMNGRQLADEIQRRNPEVTVLFTTGYTRNAIIHHGRLDDGVNFIGKPFTATALGEKVARLFAADRIS